MKQSTLSIQRTLVKLREMMERDPDPIKSRMAQVAEDSIRWAREDTRGWIRPEDGISQMAIILKGEIKK